MDTLGILWVSDERWVFKCSVPVYFLLVCVLLDVLTVIGIAIETNSQKCEKQNFLPNYIFLSLLIIINLIIIIASSIQTKQSCKNINRNNEKIYSFYLKSHTSKLIWSFLGVFMIICSILLTIFERIQLLQFKQQCPSVVNEIRYYLDFACWMYICFIIVIYILCTIFRLIFSWKMPRHYLRWKQVIDQ